MADSPYHFSQARSGVRGPAAHRGEHNREVMKDWLALTDADIDGWLTGDVLVTELGESND